MYPDEISLSTHFKLIDFTRSALADRYGIDNIPNASQKRNMVRLCESILEPLYEYFGDIDISSGFRSKKLNDILPGSSEISQHMEGLAVDITSSHASKEDLYNYILNSDLPYDQLIIYDRKNIVHVSYSNIPRKEAFKSE